MKIATTPASLCGILARPVDVGEAKRHVPRAVKAVPGREVLLAAELRGAVRRERPPLRRLRRGPVALAVDRAAAGREHDLRSVWACRFEDADRAHDVDVGVVVGPLDGDPNVGLGRQMDDELRRDRLEDGVGRPDVGLVQGRPGGDVLAPPLREIVEDVHLVAACEQRLDDVRADEACPTGDDRPHLPRILGGWAC